MTTDKTQKADEQAVGKANAEVQAKVDEATAKGYVGWVPDEVPNSAYNLTSGPDGVPLVPDDRTRTAQPTMPRGDVK